VNKQGTNMKDLAIKSVEFVLGAAWLV